MPQREPEININKWIEQLVSRAWEPLRESIAKGLEAMAQNVDQREYGATYQQVALREAARRVRDKDWDPVLQSVVEMQRGDGR